MRLVFDANLSPRLINLLSDLFPGSTHVFDFGKTPATDDLIWAFARRDGAVIVTKDSDFYHKSVTFGPPPQVIWIRAGNSSTGVIAEILRSSVAEIAKFESEVETGLLILDPKR